jgi:hypothetical protein
MTNYNLKAMIPPSLLTQQKKEERLKVLEAVRARRKIMYQRFRQKKRQLQPDGNLLY